MVAGREDSTKRARRLTNMLEIIVPVVAVGAFWYFGLWPFDRSYAYLPKYTDLGNKKSDGPPSSK
jgi:hypothetical protein